MPHSDSVHVDTPHSDAAPVSNEHVDQHGDVPESQHDDVIAKETGTGPQYTTIPHVDTPHTNVPHIDAPHTDIPHGDA